MRGFPGTRTGEARPRPQQTALPISLEGRASRPDLSETCAARPTLELDKRV